MKIKTQWPKWILRLVPPLALATILLVLVLGLAAAQGTGILIRITSATPSNRDSYNPSLSADGTVVAFESDADFLGQGIPYDQEEIWLYDTRTLTYTRVTTGSSLRESQDASLNADGTVVAFESDTDLLNEGISEDQWEVWLYDATTQTYTRVTTATGSGDRDSYDPSLNADGTVVAFRSDADFLSQGIPDNQDEIWLYNTATLTYTRVTSATGSGTRGSYAPSLSADGTRVAFHSNADLLNQGIPYGQIEVWLYDTTTLTYTRITSGTGSGTRMSYEPSISGDGTVVAFYSDSDFLNQGIPRTKWEIWLYDTQTLTYTRVTSTTGFETSAYAPSLNEDGTVVAFESDFDLLNHQPVADDDCEIWLYNTTTLTYTRVTSSTGSGERESYDASISADGTKVAFRSNSDFWHQGIPEDQREIWLYRPGCRIYLPVVMKGY